MKTRIAPRLNRGATALLAATLALGMAACGSDDDKKEGASAAVAECPWEADESVTAKARIAWQAIPNADVVVKDLGLLEACLPNAEITWVQASSGGQVIEWYGGDQVDLGLMGSSPAARSASSPTVNDVDIQTVWVHDVIGDAESLIVKDEAIEEVADLKGRTIGVPFASTAHYSLLQAISEAGLDATKDVKVINLEPDNMPAAWQGDEIDGVWVWDPVQSQLLSDGGTRILSSKDTAEKGWPTFDLGTVTTAFATENPEFLATWAKAQDHAVRLIKDDPATAAESVGVVLGIDPAEAEKQFAGLVFLTAEEQAGPDYLGGKLAVDLFTAAGFLLEQGEIEKVSPKADYVSRVNAEPASSVAHG